MTDPDRSGVQIRPFRIEVTAGMAVFAADDMHRYVVNRDGHIKHWSEFESGGHFPQAVDGARSGSGSRHPSGLPHTGS